LSAFISLSAGADEGRGSKCGAGAFPLSKTIEAIAKEVLMKAEHFAKADRTWFVTGASSGFGRAVALAALRSGGRVAAAGLEQEAIEELVRPYKDRALVLPLDVADAKAARNALERCVAQFGRVDVVYNNAGYGHVGAVEELADHELRRQLDVNLLGVINVTRAALPHMRRQRAGHFLQQSSLNGVEGLVGAAYYCASKFGIEGFSEALSDEVAHLGIKVTIVEPGPFRTRFLDDRSVKWSRPMPEYAESVGKARDTLRALNGTQPGDPDRAAQVLLSIVELERPPRRLLLGTMALEHARKSIADRQKQLDDWAEISASTDFPRTAAEIVRSAYAAFNERRTDAAVALMDAEVDWPNAPDGGFVHGREEVRRHWAEQFEKVDPRIEIDDISETSAGRVEAQVRQTIRGPDGHELPEEHAIHLFTIADDRIKRMELRH
jgi:NAD(P)-dependent dehydrogenase (short-subunit alcohol dehydrogenase family)